MPKFIGLYKYLYLPVNDKDVTIYVQITRYKTRFQILLDTL